MRIHHLNCGTCCPWGGRTFDGVSKGLLHGHIVCHCLLIETDAPYMTPEPFRGARNEPSLIGHTYRCVAQARGQEVEELAAEVATTFARVFGV